MDIVTIDFETYYDREFSLSKMTTEKYIRDPRFEVIGVAVKVNDYPTDWYSGSDPGKFLRSMDYSNKAILCHNTMFDGAILSWKFGINPKLWLDTLSMAKPSHSVTVGGSLAALAAFYNLGAKGTELVNALEKRRHDFTREELARYAEYCINDVELTYQLYKKLRRGFPATELLVIDQTIRMFTKPTIELDVRLLLEHLQNVRDSKVELIRQALKGNQIDTPEQITKVLMSNDKFAEALTNLGVEPPLKVSLRTGLEAFAFSKTDVGMQELLEHPDERVQALAQARLGVKSTIEETRTEALIGVADRGRLPIMLNYFGAHTGRFSGGDKMNLQNLPKRGNTTIRRALKAPEGHVLVACDSAQIEARVVAWLAGQESLLEAFRDGRDVYSEFATEVYGRKITKADKVERFVGKTCILGLGYGMGAEKFRRTLEIGQGGVSVAIDIEEAQRIVRVYRSVNHRIPQLWNQCNSALTAMLNRGEGSIGNVLPYSDEGVRLPNEFVLKYTALRSNGSGYEYIGDSRNFRKFIKERVTQRSEGVGYTKIYGGKMTENLVQALAAQIIREQMAALAAHKLNIVLQVHDEIVVCTPVKQAKETLDTMLTQMSQPPRWAPDLPLACEGGYASNYGDT